MDREILEILNRLETKMNEHTQILTEHTQILIALKFATEVNKA